MWFEYQTKDVAKNKEIRFTQNILEFFYFSEVLFGQKLPRERKNVVAKNAQENNLHLFFPAYYNMMQYYIAPDSEFLDQY